MLTYNKKDLLNSLITDPNITFLLIFWKCVNFVWQHQLPDITIRIYSISNSINIVSLYTEFILPYEIFYNASNVFNYHKRLIIMKKDSSLGNRNMHRVWYSTCQLSFWKMLAIHVIASFWSFFPVKDVKLKVKSRSERENETSCCLIFIKWRSYNELLQRKNAGISKYFLGPLRWFEPEVHRLFSLPLSLWWVWHILCFKKTTLFIHHNYLCFNQNSC